MAKMNELEKLQKEFRTLQGRMVWLENKYSSWKHYFEIKKKRSENRWAKREKLYNKFKHIERLLENLSIRYVAGTGGSKDKAFHILRLSSNDIRRLRLLLGSRNFMGRLTCKKDGKLLFFTRAEGKKLRKLIKKDWRIK